MRKIKLSKRIYLTAFVFIMILNISLVYVLINNVLAQNSDDKWKNQSPITVEISSQMESPLRVTLIGVDNSNPNFQVVNYTVQNIADKAIRGYVIWGNGKKVGRTISSFFPTKSFQSGVIYPEQYIVERENIESKEKLSLTVDFVDFVDGTFWGEDTQGQAEQLLGQKFGAISATEQFINLIERRETELIKNLMNKKLVEIDVLLPDFYENKSEKWKKGFSNGYKSIVSFLKSQQGKENNEILEQLRKINENLSVVGGKQ